METPQEYYKSVGPMTDARTDAKELRELPAAVAKLCEVVQGLLIHRDMAPWLYALKLTEQQRDDAHLRSMTQMLARIHALDARPLATAREPGHRMPSVCRHFALMLSAILREHGVPARARCGFGAYFTPGRFEDHWVCEYWDAAAKRWTLVDAQLDAIQRSALKVKFNTLDVPRDRFIIAGDAWLQCRSGKADAGRFGLTYINESGLWFIAGNVLRDFASLNRMEMLPWDAWGMMEMSDDKLTAEKNALLDRVAALTLAGDDQFAEMRALYDSDDRLRVPPVVFNALRNAGEPIA